MLKETTRNNDHSTICCAYTIRAFLQAEKKLLADLEAGRIDKEYLPVQGLQAFLDNTSAIILGDESKALKEGRVAVVQSLSGTHALRIAAEFLSVCFVGVSKCLRVQKDHYFPPFLQMRPLRFFTPLIILASRSTIPALLCTAAILRGATISTSSKRLALK